MNELAAIKKYLGISPSEAQLNHYTMLGISQTASLTEIKQALKNAISAWNNSDKTSDPESAQHVAKMIKQAQAVLMDEAKKKEYDKALIVKAVPICKTYFPESDPFAPFDPSQCLVGSATEPSAISFGSIEERWDELSKQIQILNSPVPPDHSSADSTFPLLEQSSTRTAVARSSSVETAAQRIERLKRSRKQKQIIYLAAFLMLAVGFLGFAGFMFVWNRQQVAKQNQANVADENRGQGLVKTKESMPKTIGGKNAPKGNADESNFVLPSLSKEDSSTEPSVGIAMGNSLVVDSEKPAVAMNPGDSMTTNVPAADPTAPAISDSPMKPEMPMNSDAPMNAAPEKPRDANPTAASRSEWVAAMKKARDAIDRADFKTFSQQSELAQSLASNDEMVTKWARLDQLGQLYEIFIKAMQEAKTKMKGAETLPVGKMIVNIVEVRENELIVRREGKNERFAWDRLPPGIANALADIALSNSEPIDVAARAVYFSLSPAKNDLFAKRVKEWFEKSAGKGKVRQDLVQALTDTYE